MRGEETRREEGRNKEEKDGGEEEEREGRGRRREKGEFISFVSLFHLALKQVGWYPAALSVLP